MASINTVESKNTSGVLVGTNYNLNPAFPTISMRYVKDDDGRDSLILSDSNVNYTPLPVSVGTNATKVLLLTYNGIDETTNALVETKVTEEVGDAPWVYYPDSFGGRQITSEENTYSIFDPRLSYSDQTGLTLRKEFLTSEANISDLYQIKIATPVLTTFPPSNIYENSVRLDGWYSSYLIVVRNYVAGDVFVKGQIVAHNDSLFLSRTGVDITPIESDDWSASITLKDWIDFLRGNIESTNSSKGFYGETQHLVTVNLVNDIIREVVKVSTEVDSPQYNLTNVRDWIFLSQRRIGAYINFMNNRFREVVVMLDSVRNYIDKLNRYNV